MRQHLSKKTFNWPKNMRFDLSKSPEPTDPVQFTLEVMQAEEHQQNLERIAAWQKQELESYQEINNSMIQERAIFGAFSFCPYNSAPGLMAVSKCFRKQPALPGEARVFYRNQATLKWLEELKEKGLYEKFPPEWQQDPAIIDAWLTELYQQMENIPQSKFMKKLDEMDPTLRPMLISMYNDATKHKSQLHSSPAPIQAERLPAPKNDDFVQTSGAAPAHEFFLTSMAKAVWGWFFPNTPSQNEELFHQELEQYQTGVDHLQQHHAKDLQKAIQTGQDLALQASTLPSMPEIERETTITAMRQTLRDAKSMLQPMCMALQQQKELQFSSLIDRHPLPVDDPLLAQIVLSHSQEALDKGLEGYQSALMLEHLLNVMSRKADSLSCNPLCDHLQKKQFCETCIGHPLDLTQEQECQLFQNIQKKMKQALLIYSAFQKGYKEFRSILETTLADLKAGDSFFFQGGWAKKGSLIGHSIVYEIIKQKENGYTFRIYNRGEGMGGLHSQSLHQNQSKYLPFIEVVDIQKEKIVSPLFLRSLQEPNDPPPIGNDWDPDHLIKTILSYLEGRSSSNQYSTDQMMEELSVGHCSFLSLDAWSNQHLGPIRHERWLLELEFNAIWDYFRGNQEKNQILLEKSIRQFSRDVEFGYQKGLVSDAELQFIQRKIAEIETFLQKNQKEIQARQIALATRTAIVPSKNSPFKPIYHPDTMDDTTTNTKDIEYHPIRTKHWVFSPKTFHTDLHALIQNISAAKTMNQPIVIKEAIREFVKKIPFDCKKESIEHCMSSLWGQMTPQEAEETLQDLALLGQEFYDSISIIEDDSIGFEIPPRDVLIQVKILTLADSLLRQFKGSLGWEPPNNILEEALWTFLDGSRPYNSLKDDPKGAIDRENLAIYWKKMSPLNYQTSFFRLETFASRDVEDRLETLKDIPPDSDVEFATRWLMQHPKEQLTIETGLRPYFGDQTLLIEGYAALENKVIKRDTIQKIEISLENHLLPPAFYHLRRLALLTHSFIHEAVLPLHSEVIIDHFYDMIVQPYIFESHYGTGCGYKPQHKTEMRTRTIPDPFNSFANDLIQHSDVWGGKSESHHRLRIAPHLRELKPAEAHFSLALSQELRSLSSVFQLQVRKTLSFFKQEQNKVLLQKMPYQTMFETLLLENNYLFEEFSNHPEEAEHLAQELALFFKEQIDFYRKIEDILTLNFFLRMNERVSRIWQFAKSKTPPFVHSQDHWRQLLDEARTPEERALRWAELSTSLAKDDLTARSASELLASQIYFDWHGPTTIKNENEFSSNKRTISGTTEDPFWTYEQEEARRDLLFEKREDLETILSNPKTRDDVLNQAASKILQENFQEKWTGHFPLFTTLSQSASVNVLEGKLYLKNAPVQNLPLRIRQNNSFKRLFGNSTPNGAEIEPKLWEFVHEGIRYRIQSDYGVKIFRFVGSEWQNYDCYGFPSTYLTERFDSWETPTKIFFEDKKTKAVVAIADIQNRHIQEIYEIVGGQKTGHILRNVWDDPDYQFLKAIEDPSWIMVWQNQKTNEPQRLELPRYHLAFEARKGKDGWDYFSKEYPGYRIATVQAIRSFPSIQCQLVLENDTTKEKRILIPKLPLRPSKEWNAKVQFDIPVIDAEISWIELQEDRLGRLQLPSVEAKLRFTELLLAHHQYREAMHFLEGCDPQDQYTFRSGEQLAPFQENELNILYRILENGDMSPDAIAIRIKAQLIMIKNNQADLLPINLLQNNQEKYWVQRSELSKSTKEYRTFLQHRKQGINPFSSEDDEKLFNQSPHKLTDSLIKLRQQQLRHLPLPSDPRTVGISIPPFIVEAKDDSLNFLASMVSYKTSVLVPNIMNGDEFINVSQLIDRSAFADIYLQLTGLVPESDWSHQDVKKKIDEMLQRVSLSEDRDLANHALDLLCHLRQGTKCKSIQETRTTLPKQVARAPSRQTQTISTPPTTLHPPASGVLGKDTPPPMFEQNMRARLPGFSEERLISHPEDYFTVTPVNHLEQTRAEMDRLFSTSMKDRIGQERSALLKDQIRTYLSSPSAKRSIYTITSKQRQMLTQLKDELAQRKARLQNDLLDQENLILALANQAPKDRTAESFREISIASGSIERLSLQELRHLAPTYDMALFKKRNPFLSEREISDLFSLIIDYQIKMTQLQQMNRISKGIEALFQAQTAHAPIEEETSLAERLYREMQAHRAYDIRLHPEYLNLEIFIDGYLRPDQIEKLALLRSDKGIGLEAPMGFGKTSVMLTMLAYLNADGKHLSMAILPESLMKSQSSELKDRVSAFGERVEVMNFVRTSDFSVDSLERTLFKLKEIIRNKKVLVMTNTSLMSFFLTYIEKSISKEASLKEIQLFREILHLFKSTGKVTIDEADFVLDVMKSHHFASGSEVPVSPTLLTTVTDLYSFLAAHEFQDIGFSFLHQNQPFTREVFQTKVKPVLIQAILDGKVIKDKETAKYIASLSPHDRKQLEKYLSNDPTGQILHGSMNVQNVFAVLKEELTTLMPLTARKNADEHYGAIPEDVRVTEEQRLFAIPYHHSNDPAIVKSEFMKKDEMANFSVFGTNEEKINYTIQMYLYHGITKRVLEKELAQLKEQAIIDYRTRQASPAVERFYQLAGDKTLSLFKPLSEKDLSKILSHINQNPQMILDLVARHVLPELKDHTEQLFASGELYGALFQSTNGFSGTMQNHRSLPDLFSEIHLSQTTEESLRLLWKKARRTSRSFLPKRNYQNSSTPFIGIILPALS